MIPILPVLGVAWKVINIAGNTIFFGQLGHSALKKYQEYKNKGKTEEEIEQELKIHAGESVQREIEKSQQ